MAASAGRGCSQPDGHRAALAARGAWWSVPPSEAPGGISRATGRTRRSVRKSPTSGLERLHRPSSRCWLGAQRAARSLSPIARTTASLLATATLVPVTGSNRTVALDVLTITRPLPSTALLSAISTQAMRGT